MLARRALCRFFVCHNPYVVDFHLFCLPPTQTTPYVKTTANRVILLGRVRADRRSSALLQDGSKGGEHIKSRLRGAAGAGERTQSTKKTVLRRSRVRSAIRNPMHEAKTGAHQTHTGTRIPLHCSKNVKQKMRYGCCTFARTPSVSSGLSQSNRSSSVQGMLLPPWLTVTTLSRNEHH